MGVLKNFIIFTSSILAFVPIIYIFSDWDRKHRVTRYLCRKFNLSLVCMPLRTLDELLNFHKKPAQWKTLVEPLASRASPRKLTEFGEEGIEVTVNQEEKREILVCHDFKGNYREDSYISEATKWDGYRFYNWYSIDIFCYFSHDLVSVPTLQYINAAHKHGVIVLGTFIVEFSHGALILEKVLESREKMEQVADSLVLVAQYCGFEGWLLNIECPVKKEKVEILIQFVEYLTTQIKREIPNGRVIWYDSVTVDGNLLWQNQVNSKNFTFFEKSDGIFLNYNWTDSAIERTLSEVTPSKRFKDVFVGIDIFGRGQVAQLNTHKTFSRIPSQLSVALFATGWTLESIEIEMKEQQRSMGTNELNMRFLARDRNLWSSLYSMLEIYGPNQLPFYSSFCIGSGEFFNRWGMRVKRKPWFDLRKQEIQPSNVTLERYFEDSFDGGSCLVFYQKSFNKIERLFITDFGYFKDLLVSYSFKRNYKLINVSLVLKLKASPTDKEQFHYLVDKEQTTEMEGVVNRAVDDEEVKTVIDKLRERGERHLPFVNSINGWEVRHHLIQCHRGHKLTDIGIRIQNEMQAIEFDSQLLLGSISVHDTSDLALINFD